MAAVQEVQNSHMTITEAAEHFNTPRSTVADHVKGRVRDFNTPGPSRELPEDVETALVDCVTCMSRQNFPE